MSRIGIAIWNFDEQDRPLCELVSEYADMGFTAISFAQNRITRLSDREAHDLRRLLEARDLVTTVHGACDVSSDQIRTIAGRLGDTLRAFTMDALKTTDSRGTLFDAAGMAPVLREVGRVLDGVPFAIEDFPLDDKAVSFYEAEFVELMRNPNYGILVDIGHMNMRCTREGSAFKGMTPLQYLSRIPLPIIEIHVHDNVGDKDSHGHLGFGNVAFPDVAEALKQIGFGGISTIEIAPSFHGSTPRESKPYAKESLDIWRSLWESSDGKDSLP